MTTETKGSAVAGAAGDGPAAARALRRINDVIGVVETAMLAALLVVLVGTGVYQAFAAHVLDKNETWTDEVIRYSVFFIAMTGASLAAAKWRMINMDVVTRLLEPKKKAALRVATTLFAVAVCFLLFKGGMDMRGTDAARALQYDIIPAPVGLLALPVGAVVIGLHFLLHALIDILWLASGKTPPEPEHAAH